MTSLQVIKSLAIGEAQLVATSVPENDHLAWNAGTTYAEGARVIQSHAIYESVQGANLDKNPATQAEWWSRVGPTNRWKAFDLSSTTQTVVGASGWFELAPGQSVSHVMLLNLTGVASARVRSWSGADTSGDADFDSTLYTETISESSWYVWTFEPRESLGELIFGDIPAAAAPRLRIDFTGSAGAAVGVVGCGAQREIGRGVRWGARIGIQDFSRKERNDYGDTHLVQRAYAKEASFNVVVRNADLNNVYDLLARLRATPCLWIGVEHLRLTTVWGFYRNFDIAISYATHSDCTIELEGLT